MLKSFCQDIYPMLCKKYPNRNIYIIGDQHFFHRNILEYTRGQFPDVFSMNQYIIKMHNEVVGMEDVVIFLGDFCFKNSHISEILERLNGHKYLILGNHDSEKVVKNYPKLGFEGVFTTPIKIKDDYLSHEPLDNEEEKTLHSNLIYHEFEKKQGVVNYHGHIHTGRESTKKNYVNVTCEALEYFPMKIGMTEDLDSRGEKPLFINSKYFDEVVTKIKEKHSIDPSILLCDYIYSFMLENISSYQDSYFVQGSFGLFKKYHFLSKFSDLDLSFLYNDSISKGKNTRLFKEMVDHNYEVLKKVDNINLSFFKRYPALRIFESSYTSKDSYYTKCFLDANLVFLDCYKETDFFKLEGKSVIENFLIRNSSSLKDEYQLPNFQSLMLSKTADLANLLLQVIYQKGYDYKKELALKKLHYVYEHTFKGQEVPDLENTFYRFLVRNISLLHTMNRHSEICYITENSIDIPSILHSMPHDLQPQVYDILGKKNAPLLEICEEISSMEQSKIYSGCAKVMKKLK